MLKLRSISKIEFDNYIKEQKNTHFMHSTAWGEFEKITNNVTPHYLGLIDKNNKIIAATILLEEHLSFNQSNLYAPRGYIIDYSNKKLLKIFTIKLKDFAKTRNATSIRINPPITVASNELNNLIELNYKRNKNTKLLEYTYKIDLSKTQKEIEKKYSENVKQHLQRTETYDVELQIGSQKNLEEFFNLQDNHKKKYYETLYDIFSNDEQTKIKLFIGKLHITKTLKTLEKNLARTNNQIALIPIDNLDSTSKDKLTKLKKQKEQISKDLQIFKKYKLEYGNTLTVNTTLIMEQNNKAWTLSEANHKILTETKLNYKLYNEYIKHYKNNSFIDFNQISLLEINKDILGFKKEFGGEYIEYIGDYVLITNHITNFIQNKIITLIKNPKRRIQNGTNKSN